MKIIALCSPDMEEKVKRELVKVDPIHANMNVVQDEISQVVIPHWPRGIFLVFSGTLKELGKCLRTAYPKGLPR